MFKYYNRKARHEFKRDCKRMFHLFWRHYHVDLVIPKAPYKNDRTVHRVNRRYNLGKKWAEAFFYNV